MLLKCKLCGKDFEVPGPWKFPSKRRRYCEECAHKRCGRKKTAVSLKIKKNHYEILDKAFKNKVETPIEGINNRLSLFLKLAYMTDQEQMQ